MSTIDHRVDIYAASAIVRLLAGRVWPGDQIPAELTTALARGLAENPVDRPADAAEWTAMMTAALPVNTRAAASGASSSSSGGRVRGPLMAGAAALIARHGEITIESCPCGNGNSSSSRTVVATREQGLSGIHAGFLG